MKVFVRLLDWFSLAWGWYSSRRDMIASLQQRIEDMRRAHQREIEALQEQLVIKDENIKFLTLLHERNMEHVRAGIAAFSRERAIATSAPDKK